MKPLRRQASFFAALILFALVSCTRREEPRAAAPSLPPQADELAGDRALQANDAEGALAFWLKALAASPNETSLRQKIAPLLMQRALARRKLHRWSEALDDYQQAKAFAPDDVEVHLGVKIFERLLPFLEAIRELDARLALTPEDDQLLSDRALLFLRSEDSELALSDAEAAAEKADWAMRPRLFRALALIGLKRAAECDALGVDPSVRLTSLPAEFLETISRLDTEISLEKESADLRLARAWQLNEIGQPRLALEEAERATKLDDKSAEACLELGFALMKLKRAEEALTQIVRATELNPQLPRAWQYRGELEMERKDFPAAIESLSRALAVTTSAELLQKREQCYMSLGEFEKAEEDHRALEKLRIPDAK